MADGNNVNRIFSIARKLTLMNPYAKIKKAQSQSQSAAHTQLDEIRHMAELAKALENDPKYAPLRQKQTEALEQEIGRLKTTPTTDPKIAGIQARIAQLEETLYLSKQLAPRIKQIEMDMEMKRKLTGRT